MPIRCRKLSTFCSRKLAIQIVIDDTTDTKTLLPLTMHGTDVSLRQVLDFVTQSAGTTYEVRDDKICITDSVQKDRSSDLTQHNEHNEQKEQTQTEIAPTMHEKLQHMVRFDWDEFPASHAIDYFSKSTGLMVTIDPLITDTINTSVISLKGNLRAETLCLWIAEAIGVSVAIREDGLYAYQTVSASFLTRTYDVADVLPAVHFPMPDPDPAVRQAAAQFAQPAQPAAAPAFDIIALTANISGVKQITGAGDGNARYVVEATEAAHQQFDEKLQEIRDSISQQVLIRCQMFPADADLGIEWDDQATVLLPPGTLSPGTLSAVPWRSPSVTVFAGQQGHATAIEQIDQDRDVDHSRLKGSG